MRRLLPIRNLLLYLLAFILLISCRSPQVTSPDISVNLNADGASKTVTVPSGSTVAQALQATGITVTNLDRTEPPAYTVLNNGNTITLTRVKEVFETQEQIIPFERQVARNESLPDGQTRLVQAGVNGKEELTYRIVQENGI